MKYRGFIFILAFVVLTLAAGLACSATSSATSTPEPANTSVPTASDTTPAAGSGSALVTFTDQNKYYTIDLPGDWAHTKGTESHLYWDRFTAPDNNAFVENIAYDDGTVWTGSANGKAVLYLLNNIYSYTKKDGDIKIIGDSIQPDSSERLTWTSKGGSYSGVSYFEVRNGTTFLMFTMVWNNDQESTYVDMLNKVVASYKNPNA